MFHVTVLSLRIPGILQLKGIRKSRGYIQYRRFTLEVHIFGSEYAI
jgi:hypothetical protein